MQSAECKVEKRAASGQIWTFLIGGYGFRISGFGLEPVVGPAFGAPMTAVPSIYIRVEK